MTLDTLERVLTVAVIVALAVAVGGLYRWNTALEKRLNSQDDKITALGGEIIAGYGRVIEYLTSDCEDCGDEDESIVPPTTGHPGSTGDVPQDIMAGEGRADVRTGPVVVSDVSEDHPAAGGTPASVIVDWGER